LTQQIEFEKGLENITIVGEPFNSDNKLEVEVLNSGSIDLELSWITIFDPITREPILDYTALDNVLLRPYQSRIIDSIDQIFPGSYDQSESYQIQIITKRGTIVEYRHPRPIPLPKKIMTQFIGPFFFDLNEDSFKITSQTHSDPVTAYEMRDDESNLMFWLQVTNYGEENIELNGLSYIELIIHEIGINTVFESEVYFYLVDSSSESNSLVAYDKLNPVVVESGETTILKFASKQAFHDDFNQAGILQGYIPHNNEPGTENLLWSYIALFWRYEDSSSVYGKTIPFVAIHLEPY
jgi:hypothetical protein